MENTGLLKVKFNYDFISLLNYTSLIENRDIIISIIPGDN
jgi:hypothetical protein